MAFGVFPPLESASAFGDFLTLFSMSVSRSFSCGSILAGSRNYCVWSFEVPLVMGHMSSLV